MGIKRRVNIMESIHVRDVKDFSSVRCARSCLMLAVKTRIVSLTKDNEIDVNTAGKKFNHLISRIFFVLFYFQGT